MKRALGETVIAGVPTTIPFHELILENEAFKAGDVDTGFIAKHGDQLAEPLPKKEGGINIVVEAAKRAERRKSKSRA